MVMYGGMYANIGEYVFYYRGICISIEDMHAYIGMCIL